jgi:mannosyltransferase
VYLVGRQVAGRTAALVAAAYMALSPFAIFYGSEARAYAVLMFCVTLSCLCLLRAVETRRPGWWVAWGAAAAAVVYSHYTGIPVLVAQAAWALTLYRGQAARLVASAAAAAALFAIWLPQVHAARGVSGFRGLAGLMGFDKWDAFLQWVAGYPGLPPETLPGQVPLLLLGAGAAIGLAGHVEARTRMDRRVGLVLLLALATPVSLLLNSFVGDDYFVFPRNLSASLPFAALLIGWLVTPPRRALALAAGGLAGVALVAGARKTPMTPTTVPTSPRRRRPSTGSRPRAMSWCRSGRAFARSSWDASCPSTTSAATRSGERTPPRSPSAPPSPPRAAMTPGSSW